MSNQIDLFKLNEMLYMHLSELLAYFSVKVSKTGNMMVGACPVHHGDNPNAFNIYLEGYAVHGVWYCRTHHCEIKYKKTLIGLTRGLLSAKTGKDISFVETLDWIKKFLKIKDLSQLIISDEERSKREYASQIKKLQVEVTPQKIQWTRESIRKILKIPSNYFIDRGFSPNILDKYDVGIDNTHKRAIVPIYDNSYKGIIGFTGRSIFPQCPKCFLWHSGECATTEVDKKKQAKWLNSIGFNSGTSLYNYWFAKPYIMNSHSVILVEGTSDVWKLIENNIFNVVALYGTNLTEQQQTILNMSGVMSVIVMLDLDKAGYEGSCTIKNKLKRQYNLYFPRVPSLQEDNLDGQMKNLLNTILNGSKQ